MPRPRFCTLLLLVIVGCASRGQPFGQAPIVDLKGVDPAQYRVDLLECRQYADEVAVGSRAVAGAASGAVVGGLVGAAVGDSDTAKRGAGAGAVLSGARGTGEALREQQTVVRNCLRHRGYAVLN